MLDTFVARVEAPDNMNVRVCHEVNHAVKQQPVLADVHVVDTSIVQTTVNEFLRMPTLSTSERPLALDKCIGEFLPLLLT